MRRPLPWLALLCHFVLATGYALGTPAFEGPDENSHYEYAQHLANAGTLPLPPALAQQRGLPQSEGAVLAHHPPLYYSLLAILLQSTGRADTVFGPLTNPTFGQPGAPAQHLHFRHGADERAPLRDGQGTLRLLRFVSVLLGACSLISVLQLAHLACPSRPGVADAAVLLLACSPMWSFLHGVLNSDVLAITICCATLPVLAQLATEPRRSPSRPIGLGALLGAALLTKLTTLFLLPLTGIVYAAAARRRPYARRALLLEAALTMFVVAAVSGWWFWRNHTLFGDLLARNVHDAAFAPIPPDYRWAWLTGGFLPQVFPSLLGTFGWFSLPPHPLLVWSAAATTALALLGLVLPAADRAPRPRPLWLLTLACLLVFAGTAHFNWTAPQPQGRLLLAAAAPGAVLLAAGLVRGADRVRLTRYGVAFAALPPAIAAVVFFAWFRPAFDPTLAPAPATHAALVGDLVGDDGATGIRWRGEPPPPASTAPVLRFLEPGAPAGASYTLYAYDHGGRVWLALHEWSGGRLAAQDGAPLPQPAFEFLPRGVDVLLRLRRVPDWAAGERAATMPTSPPLPFRRE
ncbi:MAG: glycosyltransferase family 39 protein [Planctomycetes bacterium]|nr:glycosyltransferase family 39 protein [Planctomycetota bacterium]